MCALGCVIERHMPFLCPPQVSLFWYMLIELRGGFKPLVFGEVFWISLYLYFTGPVSLVIKEGGGGGGEFWFFREPRPI